MSEQKALIQPRENDDDTLVLTSPGVGRFRRLVSEGDLLAPGQKFGLLFVLGRAEVVVVPKGAGGRVVSASDAPEIAVGYRETLVTLDPTGAADVEVESDQAGTSNAELVFRAPMSGRFYARPSPDQPAFVSAGDTVKRGQAVGLLEVMKTFNRVPYGGDELPETAAIVRVVPNDGDDVDKGDVLLELKIS